MARMYMKMGKDRECSNCGGQIFIPSDDEEMYDYCPHCGELLDLEDDA